MPKSYPSSNPTPARKGDTPSPDPTPVDAFGVSIRVPSALDPPDHISGYGPESRRFIGLGDDMLKPSDVLQ